MASPVSIPDSPGTEGTETADHAVRIAYVDPQSYHGLAKYDAGYLRGLREAGFDGEVRFYCSILFGEREPDRVELRPIFRYNAKRSRPAKAFSYVWSMLRLTLEAISRPADLYHFQWFKLPLADYIFVLVLRKIARARVAMTAHNVVPHGEEGRPHRWLGHLYRTVDAILVHHAQTATEIAERFSADSSRIVVLRHGPLEIEANGRPRYRRRVRRFGAQHDLCFLFMGRGSRYKGLDLLLEAWARFIRVAPGRPGLIVMGGVDAELEDLAADAARKHASLLLIDEHVAESDLYHAMRRADVAVLPHRRISQSGVLLAALARRMPVLVSSVPGLVEPFEFGRVGWQFDGTVEGLVDRLLHLAARPEEVAEVRADEQGWRAVEEAYAWRGVGLCAREVYRQIIEC